MLGDTYQSAKSFLSSLLFPRICVGCGKDIRWICDDCLKKIDIIKQPFCPECRRLTQNGEFCEKCCHRYKLDGTFICANLDEGILKESIHQFKYEGVFDIGGILGKIMVGRLNHELRIMNYELRFDLIIPVPLHPKRLRERGFNQSEILAREICCGGMVLRKDILVRKRYTVPQMELGREERLENLKGIFEVGGADSVARKNILLVDDITTTGATLEECAKVLKKSGAGRVWSIVLAKGK